MKTQIYLMLAFFTLAFTSSQSQTNYVKVDKSKVVQEELEFAKDLSNKLLTAQKNGGYYSLSENEATKKMVDGLNESRQISSYSKIKSLFGDYRDLKFESLMKNKYLIYRFKGVFDSGADIEIRAVLNNKRKLAGFFVRPWKETL